MQKKYYPVRIKNPSSKDSLVCLLAGQKINIIFDKEENQDLKCEVSGHLFVEEVVEIKNGWMISICQKKDEIDYCESSLYLGNINFFDDDNKKKASLCVVAKNENDNFLKIIDPENIKFNLYPSQILDVSFISDSSVRWESQTSGKDMCLEQIQYVIKPKKDININDNLIEHFFRFRFSASSIEYISEMPYAKYDGGKIVFTNNKKDKNVLQVVCAWRGKESIYKALLLPKIPNHSIMPFIQKINKKCLQSNISLKIIDCSELDSGCNVLLSKVF